MPTTKDGLVHTFSRDEIERMGRGPDRKLKAVFDPPKRFPAVVTVDMLHNHRYRDGVSDQLGLKEKLLFWGERHPNGDEYDASVTGKVMELIEPKVLAGEDKGEVLWEGTVYEFEVTHRE